jgi:hypothetical protein
MENKQLYRKHRHAGDTDMEDTEERRTHWNVGHSHIGHTGEQDT